MPIEKMPQVVNAKTSEEYLAEFIGIVYRKINELIEQVNYLSETKEYKKSQISWVLDDLEGCMSRLKHIQED